MLQVGQCLGHRRLLARGLDDALGELGRQGGLQADHRDAGLAVLLGHLQAVGRMGIDEHAAVVMPLADGLQAVGMAAAARDEAPLGSTGEGIGAGQIELAGLAQLLPEGLQMLCVTVEQVVRRPIQTRFPCGSVSST